MCNPKPSSPSSFICTTNKNHFLNPNKPLQMITNFIDGRTCPRPHEEMKEIGKISCPTTMTGLILYSRAMISMLFLGYLSELELAGGSLSMGVANITGYSVISGLAMGMEPICGQAYGAKQMKLLGLTLQRTVLLLGPVMVRVAGGLKLLCDKMVKGFKWSVQGHDLELQTPKQDYEAANENMLEQFKGFFEEQCTTITPGILLGAHEVISSYISNSDFAKLLALHTNQFEAPYGYKPFHFPRDPYLMV